ncbi:MAG: hypothetical protein NTU53_11325 [Planctomycetota bacterium]|nr:hypothetical protein [Planctomycetota bacterium]
MAWLEKRGNRFRIKFRYGDRELRYPLKTASQDDADAALSRLVENLALLNRGRLELPEGADIGLFLLSDGKLTRKPKIESVSFKEYFKRYRERQDGKEKNTRDTEKIHMAHLERLLSPRTVQAVTTADLQGYVDKRSQEGVSHTTIKKEIGTFAAIWNKWGVPQAVVSGPAPTKGLLYKKGRSKPPFQTWQQIERAVARGTGVDSCETRVGRILVAPQSPSRRAAARICQLHTVLLRALPYRSCSPVGQCLSHITVFPGQLGPHRLHGHEFTAVQIQLPLLSTGIVG